MRPHVEIIGSGQNQTTISGSRSGGASASGSLIVGADGTLLKDLKIINDVNEHRGLGVYFDHCNASMKKVILHQNGSPSAAYGIYIQNSTVSLNSVDILMSLSTTTSSYGLYISQMSEVDAQEIAINIIATDGINKGLRIADTSKFHSNYIAIDVHGNGSEDNTAIFIHNSRAKISSADIDVYDGSVRNYGIHLNATSKSFLSDSDILVANNSNKAYSQAADSSSIINNSTLSGGIAVQNDDVTPIDLDIIASTLTGLVVNGINCIRCVDGSGAELGSDCKP